MKRREKGIDVAKGIVILLVVLGHLVSFNGYLWRIIFSFHMPFFFIMSGYCTRNNENSFSRYLIKYTKSLLIPTFICRIIFLITGYGGVSFLSGVKESIQYILYPFSEWFISSLFLSKILFFIWHKGFSLIEKLKTQLIYAGVTIAALFFCGQLWSERWHGMPEFIPFPIDCALVGTVFVIVGFLLKNVANLEFNDKVLMPSNIWGGICVAAVIIWLTKYNTYINLCDMYFGKSTLTFLIFASVETILICCFSSLISEKQSKVVTVLEAVGKNTILVYPGHCLLFYFLNKLMFIITGTEYIPMHQFTNELIILYFAITILIFIPLCFFKERRKLKAHCMESKFFFAILASAIWVLYPLQSEAAELQGKGTEDNPYLISSVNDLVSFRDMVNEGEAFENCYFLQTQDLDLGEIDNWIPIGIMGTDLYFEGVYDGGGHAIVNLFIDREDNCGFFGLLEGEIKNLGIESGCIVGSCVGSLASHGGVGAKITNCYNKATVIGSGRAGGIADNFTAGDISFCCNMGKVVSDNGEIGGIVSYGAHQVTESYTTVAPIYPDSYVEVGWTGMVMEQNEIECIEFVQNLNYLLGRYGNENGKMSLWGYYDQTGGIGFDIDKKSKDFIIGRTFFYINQYIIDMILFIIIVFSGRKYITSKKKRISCHV